MTLKLYTDHTIFHMMKMNGQLKAQGKETLTFNRRNGLYVCDLYPQLSGNYVFYQYDIEDILY